MSRELRRWAPLLAVGALLAAAALAAALATPRLHEVPPLVLESPAIPAGAATTSVSASPPGDAIRPRQPIVINIPDWFDTTVSLVIGALVLALLGGALWYVLRDSLYVRTRRITTDEGSPGGLLVADRQVAEAIEAVEEGLGRLADEDGDPRAAVIACWVRLEQLAAAAGTPREPGDTPAELVGRLLAGHPVSRPLLDRLAALYRAARYARHDVGRDMREQARSALRQLRDELAQHAGHHGAGVPAGAEPAVRAPRVRPAAPDAAAGPRVPPGDAHRRTPGGPR